MVAWDDAVVESANIATDLVLGAYLKERYLRPSGFDNYKCQQEPLILDADNFNAMRAAKLKSCLEEIRC